MNQLVLWSILIGSLTAADRQSVPVSQVRELAPGQFQWQLTLPDQDQIRMTASGLGFSEWNTTTDENGFLIPVLSKLVHTANGPPDIQITSVNYELLTIQHALHPVFERAKGADIPGDFQRELSPALVVTKLIRTEGDHQLWAVTVKGAQYDNVAHVWRLPTDLIIQINTDLSGARSQASDDLYINQLVATRSNRINTSQTGFGQGKLKLLTLSDGIYRIFFDSLETLPGFPDESIQSESLNLTQGGEAQPIFVHDGGDGVFNNSDYFDFIGRQNYFQGSSQYFDPFSDINVYWLNWGVENGLRFIEESGALVDPDPVRPNTFWDRVHIEEDLLFDRLGQVDTDLPTITRDHYFWHSVNSGHTEEVQFDLAHPFRGSSENVQVSIGLHGLTYSEETGETAGHTLFAFLNDISIGEGTWTQQEEYTLVSPTALNLSHNILSDGTNTLALFAPVSTEPGNYDRIVLNWIEIGYEHLLTAVDDALRFRKSYINPSTDLEYEIKGFSSPDLVLYKEGLSRITGYNIRESWDSEQAEFSLVFQDRGTDATPDYWTSSVDRLLQPVKTLVDTVADLRQQDGDLIVISIPEFMDGLDQYLDFKMSEGWDPIAVSVADIYDEFNYGINSPFAIKSFLKYANNHWISAPEYVVIIGDATANPQQVKRDSRLRHIPTFYMQTYGWGAAEADFWYSLINGDDYLPDLHIGRIPCSDTEDLEISLAKLIHYPETTNFGTWQNELITIAGFDTTFKIQTGSLLRHSIPKAYMPSRIFIDRDSEGQIFWGDTDSLVAQWNAGKLLINFLGHGGGAVWADRSLFVRDDIQYLDPDTPPAFVTSMTCFTASFAQTRGLGEVVLTESPAGAIGWFGSSGVGWVINDYLLIQPMLRHLMEDHRPVGEAIDITRMEYYLPNTHWEQAISMLFQYNFLGDPTTRLALPVAADLLVSQKPIYTQTDQLDLRYTGSEPGTITLLPVDANGHPWWSAPQSYATSSVQQFLLNQAIAAPSGEGRTIFSFDRGNETPALQGYVSYSISADWFEHDPPTAELLELSNIIPLQVQFHSQTSMADSLVVIFTGGNSQQVDMLVDQGLWTLPETFRMTAGNSNTYYYFKAFQAGQYQQTSATFRLYLPVDISLSVNGIQESVLGNRVGWLLTYSLQGLPQGIATLKHAETAPGFHQSISKQVLVKEGNNTLFIPSFLGSGEVGITDSLLIDQDSNLSDNALQTTLTPSYYQVLPDLGISFDGVAADTIPLWAGGYLVSSAPDSGWIRVQGHAQEIESLPGVNLFQDSIVYQIDTYTQEPKLEISSPRSLFLKDPDLAPWQILSHTASYYQLHGQGLVAMGAKQNTTGPQVSMMVEGQLFFDGDYILENCRLNLLAEDENGFSWNKQDIEVLVDGSPVTVQLGDTTATGRIISIVANLDLSIGEHQIVYRVRDALGNWSATEEVSGVVAGEAKVIDYGNYPNPFQGETLIIYELTQPLRDLVIEIFTVSGYKLDSIDGFNARVGIPLGAIGFHEVPWNGRDRHENFVANGIYFYRIKGEIDGKVLVGPVGKMVKNR